MLLKPTNDGEPNGSEVFALAKENQRLENIEEDDEPSETLLFKQTNEEEPNDSEVFALAEENQRFEKIIRHMKDEIIEKDQLITELKQKLADKESHDQTSCNRAYAMTPFELDVFGKSEPLKSMKPSPIEPSQTVTSSKSAESNILKKI